MLSIAAGFSLLAFVGGLLALPWLVAAIPEDYFVGDRRPVPVSRRTGRPRHPAVVWSARIGKNVAGGTLILAGVAMLVLPGQGVLTILAGVVLTDMPGKRRLERAIVRRSLVLRALNALRRRRGVGPLRVD
ncbi:PGPGW domain-containing protein [Alienimonas californiensis]|uniref:PGPGW domain-containing protein n=1 Tax=Alienimonas californiensis TaxID=2527989 RepID=UPI001A99855F|nr:PGPGW domain-containing protein [Alienimonas californiensis]